MSRYGCFISLLSVRCKLRSNSVFQSNFQEDYEKDKTNLRMSRYGSFFSLLSVGSKLLKLRKLQCFRVILTKIMIMSKQTSASRAMAASSRFLASAASCAREASILESSACDFAAVTCMSAI